MTACEFMKSHDWCQGSFARDAKGNSVDYDDGVSFCIMGAVEMAYGQHDGLVVEDKLRKALPNKYGKSLINFNDHHGQTKKAVVKFLCEVGV